MKKINEYLIQGKGYVNVTRDDATLTGKQFCDITSRNGCIEFKGTEDQLDIFLTHLYEDETTFKVIGVYKENE
tara:strand:- start:3762 stop:3980 length:219 start_codon:yes stop_codon:yes gene_type:complete